MAGESALDVVEALKCVHGLGEGWGYDWPTSVVPAVGQECGRLADAGSLETTDRWTLFVRRFKII